MSGSKIEVTDLRSYHGEEKFTDTNSISFTVSGIDVSLANSLRRIMISEVETMCLDEIGFHKNTTVFFDEFLAHRLALIPFRHKLGAAGMHRERQLNQTPEYNSVQEPNAAVDVVVTCDVEYVQDEVFTYLTTAAPAGTQELTISWSNEMKKPLGEYLGAIVEPRDERGEGAFAADTSVSSVLGNMDAHITEGIISLSQPTQKYMPEGTTIKIDNIMETGWYVNGSKPMRVKQRGGPPQYVFAQTSSSKLYRDDQLEPATEFRDGHIRVTSRMLAVSHDEIEPAHYSCSEDQATCGLDDGIVIVECKKGHSLKFEGVILKGCGMEHAKWSPVSCAAFRPMPHIELNPKVLKELALHIETACPRVAAPADAGSSVLRVQWRESDIQLKEFVGATITTEQEPSPFPPGTRIDSVYDNMIVLDQKIVAPIAVGQTILARTQLKLHQLQRSCPNSGVLELVDNGDGWFRLGLGKDYTHRYTYAGEIEKVVAQLRREDDDPAIVIKEVPNAFIFRVETTGALTPYEVVAESIYILRQKLESLGKDVRSEAHVSNYSGEQKTGRQRQVRTNDRLIGFQSVNH